jgi:uncharacterized protein YkwD
MSDRLHPLARLVLAFALAIGALWTLAHVPAWGKRGHGRHRSLGHRRHHRFNAAAGTACPGANATPEPGRLAEAAVATLCLVNEQRSQAGLVPLHNNPELDLAARRHSHDMVLRDYFDHTAPGPVTFDRRIRRAGYLARAASFDIGENLGEGTSGAATPASMVTGWMQSPEHRANILTRDYRDSGIGIAAAVPASFGRGARGATYTQDFGRRG